MEWFADHALEVGGAAFAVLVWFIRLESRVNSAHARLDAQSMQRDEDQKAALAARAETNALLAEMRADIKTLLRDHGK